jgi:Protein of unknown function (DUF3300)
LALKSSPSTGRAFFLGILAQGLDSGDQNIFPQEELDQMLAPVALYPDELLEQQDWDPSVKSGE